MFKEKLKSLRKEYNLTQVELANKIFVSRSLIARWEYGDIYPSIENLNKIAEHFNIPISELLCENEKTELIINQVNMQHNIRKKLRIFLLGLIVFYSAITPIFYFLKIFSITGYDFSNSNGIINIFYYSIIDCINPNNFWLIIASIIANLMLIIFSILTFTIKNNKIKMVLFYLTGLLILISLIFMILTFVIGNKNAILILPKIIK